MLRHHFTKLDTCITAAVQTEKFLSGMNQEQRSRNLKKKKKNFLKVFQVRADSNAFAVAMRASSFGPTLVES